MTLKEKTGHVFADDALLEEAFTHPSFRHEHGLTFDNQRLEFLGDAVLSLLLSDALMKIFSAADEGELTRRRSALVRGKTLAGVAREIELGSFLRFGQGELKSGGAEKESNLADALEALIGAVWLDGGEAAARAVIKTLFAERLKSGELESENPKGVLQELAAAKGWGIPEYRVVAESGPAHDRCYTASVDVRDQVFEGEGSSRREAEKTAAQKAVAAFC